MKNSWPTQQWLADTQCLLNCKSDITRKLYMRCLKQIIHIVMQQNNNIHNAGMISRDMLIMALHSYLNCISVRSLLPSTIRCLFFRMLSACKSVWTDIYKIRAISYNDILQQAIQNNIPHSVHNLIQLKNSGAKQINVRNDAFTVDECAKLLQSASAMSVRDLLMLELMLTTGVRIGSLCRMKWQHIDHQWRYMHGIEKGNKHRIIVLHTKLADLLKKLKESQRKRTQFIFVSNRRNQDTALTSRWLRERFYVIGSHALPGMRIFPHMCRQTVVHRLFENKNSLTHISRFLGHASTTTTNQYYLKYSVEELVQQMKIPWLSFKTT